MTPLHLLLGAAGLIVTAALFKKPETEKTRETAQDEPPADPPPVDPPKTEKKAKKPKKQKKVTVEGLDDADPAATEVDEPGDT